MNWNFGFTINLLHVGACFLIYLIFKLVQNILRKNIKNKAVFITGCDHGFGKSLAHAFLAEKCVVFAGCLLQKNVDDYNSLKNPLIRGLKVDVTKQEDLDAAVKKIEEANIPLLCIVNNAGITSFGWCEMIDIETYRWIGDVNIYGAIRTCKTFLPLLRKDQGRIINMGSIGPILNAPFGSAYLCSKAAMMSFSSCLAQELHAVGVKVSVIMPGFFKTNLLASGNQRGLEESKKIPEMEKIYGSYSKKMNDVQEKILQSEWLNGDGSSVCQAAIHAASVYFPPYRYVVGYDAHFAYFVSLFIPHRLLEMVSSLI